eukprot:symbB.v1.2.026084.t1/scaffold2508.1/size77433/4
MRCRLVAFLSVLIASLAERPSLQRKLVVDAGFGGSGSSAIIEHHVARDGAAQRKRTCRQEAALRTVLLDLGLKDSELTDIRNVEGVKWSPLDACSVWKISFALRKDLRGTLSQGFKELKGLQKLDLSDTKISGDLAVLANCRIWHLILSNTLVSGNLAALTARIRILDLSNSKVTGNLGALKAPELNAVRLSNTTIAGDVAVLDTWPYIREVDLSDTEVTGTFQKNYVYEVFNNLEVLKLRGTRTKIDIGGLYGQGCPFEAMTTLEVSGLAMDASVSEFLAPLLYCDHLNSIGAAGCGLTGEVPKTVVFRFTEVPLDETDLGKVLVFLDLASNRIDRVDSVPERLKTMVLAGNTNMSFADGVLQKAVRDGILLDVQNVTFTNQTETADLLDAGLIRRTSGRSIFDLNQGFSCYDLDSKSLQVSPAMFAPNRLCSCNPGWKGTGATCEKCPADSFSDEYSSKECTPCPPGSKAVAGATSVHSCVCDVGVLYNTTGSWKCGCPIDKAMLDGMCVNCLERGLKCSSMGSEVCSAQALPGFARLDNESRAYKCLTADRCNATRATHDGHRFNSSTSSTSSVCTPGYQEVMCSSCAPDFFSSGERCVKCPKASDLSATPTFIALVLALVLALGAVALTLLYIGGASSSSSLLSCQETDGANEKLPEQFVFRTLMPNVFCNQESQLKTYADVVGFSSVFCYAIVIPLCLLYLYGKQHIVLRASRTTSVAAFQMGHLTLCLNEVLGSDTLKISRKEEDSTLRLVAAAAAYISVLYRGRVSLQIADGDATVKQIGGTAGSDRSSDLLETDVFSVIGGEDAKRQSKLLKCRAITEMLTERVVLRAAPTDRVLLGAKNLLLKYTLCRHVWMEIVQKLVAVALVSVVSSANGFQLSVALSLGMAAASALVQPYAQPQVNTLHCSCFLCLALAAFSFAHDWLWPGRAALALPFALSAVQAFQPDSAEKLAVRLWEELESQMEALQHGEMVLVTAETQWRLVGNSVDL